MSDAWSQLEQLLTCCICLDRYRSPKLLPCQHSFCEPCTDGLVDYARRQIKCPECRAEHRLPYTGEPNFPTNFTLMRFLELYQRLTGEEVEPLPSMLERCTVCSEKVEVTICAHCDKKTCSECKSAHIQVMQRELQRLNAQIRRALIRFNEELGHLLKCDEKLKLSCDQTRASISDLAANLICLIKEKEKQLLKELDDFQESEDKNLKKLHESINEEYNNLIANCELLEKNVLIAPFKPNQSYTNLTLEQEEEDQKEMINWSDQELVECREILFKTLDFLRNFENLDCLEYSRTALKIDFIKDLDILRRNAANYASLKVQYLATEKLQLQQQLATALAAGLPSVQTASGSPNYGQLGSMHAINQGLSNQLNLPSQQSLLRSQSDHRLAAQFAKKELLQQQASGVNNLGLNNKYGTNYSYDYDSNNQYNTANPYSTPNTQYRSRFMREKAELNALHDSDDPYDTLVSHRTVRFDEPQLPGSNLAAQLQNAFRVFDTKNASRCPLSNVVKLNESVHLMERIEENKRKIKKTDNQKVEDNKKNDQTLMQIKQKNDQTQKLANNPKAIFPSRQISEDEIDKQKKLNKQFEQQSLSASTNINNTNVNNPNVVNTPSITKQLQKQISIHGNEPVLVTNTNSSNTISQQPKMNSVATAATSQVKSAQTNLQKTNQTTSSEPEEGDEEEDEEEDDDDDDDDEDNEDEDESDEEDEKTNAQRQVISSTIQNSNKTLLSSQQRPSFEESESKLLTVSAVNDLHNEIPNKNISAQLMGINQTNINNRRLSNSVDQNNTNANALINIGRASSIDREYPSSNNFNSTTNKLSRQNSANSTISNTQPNNLASSSVLGSTYLTPRNSIDTGNTNFGTSGGGSRNNSFDRDANTSSSGYRYLTRANTRLDDLTNRDSYLSSDNSSTNHNRFNRFNRLARSSTVSSLSPSYTNTSSTNLNPSSIGITGGTSNYRNYDLDSSSASNYLSSYGSNRNSDNSYSSLRSRPSSPPPSTRTSAGSSGTTSGLSRYGIGNSSVGTSSGYRRPNAYTPDTSLYGRRWQRTYR